jgi:hypothetical protein
MFAVPLVFRLAFRVPLLGMLWWEFNLTLRFGWDPPSAPAQGD